MTADSEGERGLGGGFGEEGLLLGDALFGFLAPGLVGAASRGYCFL